MLYSFEMMVHRLKEFIIKSISMIPGVGKYGKDGYLALLFLFSFSLLLIGIIIGMPFVFSTGLFLSCIFLVLFLCWCSVIRKTSFWNISFFLLFLFGVCCYCLLDKETSSPHISELIADENAQTELTDNAIPDHEESNDRTFLSAIHHSNEAISAFFPSRGSYDFLANGVVSTGSYSFKVSKGTMLLYELYHALVYVFVSSFVVLLWGTRLINRLRFWVTLDEEKNVFWCMRPEPKMICLAKSIRENAGKEQVVFSVDESSTANAKALFQEMNYHKYCLKLRKPTQIHENCLRAGKNFFLSEDVDWNIKKAQDYLTRRKELNIKTFTKIYISVSSNSRKLYYDRWADQNNRPGEVEIVLVNECEIIAGRLVQSYPMLQSPGIAILDNARISGSFKVLIVGFGKLGQAILKNIVCDSQFINADGNRTPFYADIIDGNISTWNLYQGLYPEACSRFHFHFERMQIPSVEFVNFVKKNLASYTRIVIAVGNDSQNIETASIIEKIIRKTIDISNSPDPREELELYRKKVFLVSPEIKCAAFKNKNNLFTVIGADYEDYNYDEIVNEKLEKMAKLLDFNYRAVLNPEQPGPEKETVEKKIHALRSKGFTPKLYSMEYYLENRLNIPRLWYTDCDENGMLFQPSMSDRESSRASAANLDNFLRILKIKKEELSTELYRERIKDEKLLDLLAENEHLRWMAFSLFQGMSLWEDPKKTDRLKKANQTENYLRHACLLDFADPSFENVNRTFSDDFGKKDREIIYALPDIVLFDRFYNQGGIS